MIVTFTSQNTELASGDALPAGNKESSVRVQKRMNSIIDDEDHPGHSFYHLLLPFLLCYYFRFFYFLFSKDGTLI